MNTNEFLDVANKAYHNNNFMEALAEYEQEIMNRPENILAYDGAARCLANLNKFTDSIAMCQRLLELDPTNIKAHIILAEVYQVMNQIPKSRSEIQLAYTIAPADGEVLTSYGSLLLRDNKIDEARDMLEEAIQRNPSIYIAHNNLFFIYAKKRDRNKVYGCAKKMYRLRPTIKNKIRLVFAFMDYIWLSNIFVFGLYIIIYISLLIQNWTTFIFAITILLLMFVLKRYSKGT